MWNKMQYYQTKNTDICYCLKRGSYLDTSLSETVLSPAHSDERNAYFSILKSNAEHREKTRCTPYNTLRWKKYGILFYAPRKRFCLVQMMYNVMSHIVGLVNKQIFRYLMFNYQRICNYTPPTWWRHQMETIHLQKNKYIISYTFTPQRDW